MGDVVLELVQWGYGIRPSYGPAIVLASAVISAVLAPLVVLEVRSQWRIVGEASAHPGARDPDMGDLLLHRGLFRGPHLALMVIRRALLLASAIWVLLTVIGLTRSRGELPFAGVDLGRSVLAVAIGQGIAAAVAHLVIPLVFVLVHAVAGNRPLGGVRNLHLVGASLISLLAPGALVLHLLTVLLFNIGLVKLMTLVATRRRRPVGGVRGRRSATPVATGRSSGNGPRWDDFVLPADRRQAGLVGLRGGWLWCAVGVAWVVAGLHSIVTAVPDLSNPPPDLALRTAYPGLLFEFIGMYCFRKGAKYRWMGQHLLSRTSAYRYEHGYPQPTASLAVLNGSLPGQSRRRGTALMAAGGLGACGTGFTAVTVGLWYLWQPVVGGQFSPWHTILPLGLGVVLMAQGNFLLREGFRHHQRVISSPRDLAPGSYALYLRSFEEDPELARLYRVIGPSALVRGVFTVGSTQEEQLAEALAWAGLPVGVGHPGERLPRVGIPRMYLPLHDWQEPVRELMRGAGLVVLTLGQGAGIVWELGEAMRILPPERLVLLVTMPKHEYDRCKEAVGAELRKQATAVRRETGVEWTPPRFPDYAGRGIATQRIRGVIHFTPEWRAVFAPLERPPILENQLMGALDRSTWPVVVRLTDYERRTGRRCG